MAAPLLEAVACSRVEPTQAEESEGDGDENEIQHGILSAGEAGQTWLVIAMVVPCAHASARSWFPRRFSAFSLFRRCNCGLACRAGCGEDPRRLPQTAICLVRHWSEARRDVRRNCSRLKQHSVWVLAEGPMNPSSSER